MTSTKPKAIIAATYEEYAREYLSSLPLEHLTEATSQARQREITLESLALVKARRPDVHVFNELLVQYPRPSRRRPGQVVPDNMVVISEQPLEASSSYNMPVEPVGPFWVLEYVSKNNKRKDYDDNFDKYEQELKVPYFLLFYPETKDLTLYRHTGEKYASVKPNEYGRYPIPELELELALLDNWVRYWHRGELLPLPADLQRDLDQARRQVAEATARAEDLQRRLDEAERALADLRGRTAN
jgi:Uma2 family endonuclease